MAVAERARFAPGERALLRAPLVLALGLALQSSIAPQVRVLGVAPEIMLCLAVAAGLSAGPERGAIFGFATGVLYDLVLQTPFGLSALVFCVAAYAVGFVQLQVLRSGWWIRPAIVGAASGVAVLAEALIATLIGLSRIIDSHLVVIALVVAIENTVLAPLALFGTRWALMGGGRERS